ncbi:GMC family oxidoreductase [Candidatus Solirubrobacter pratensis]|uniref:GMC family oxidoreductase n=1 Tax=Candidatus Solirubrobacter pratensis TaxID=1298857 RepID=UPI0004274581|nr:GMC family oxidoreductase [Candidatus Solirubrobacter pratensis]
MTLPAETDTVVVGSGPAGCALAGRLAAAGADVVLLEAGPDLGPRDSGRWDAGLLDASALSTSYDWGYSSEATYPDRVVAFERARVLGGCSSHNGCAAIRGARADYDGWRQPGWATEDLVPLFEQAERAFRVHRYTAEEVTPFHAACLEAAQAAGIPLTADLNDLDEHEAIGIAPVNIDGGVRFNAAFAFLDRDYASLRVIGDAAVGRVLLEGSRAVGVALADGRELRAARVVLAAGTYESPAILQRSGIGPADLLAAAGIACVHDRPGVGANLHDHPAFVVGFAGGPELERRHAERTGWTPEEQSIAKLRSSHCTEAFDLHLYPLGGPHPRRRDAWRWELPVACMTPRSRGTVAVASADPAARPRIDHAYLSDEHDLDVLADGVELMREIAARMPLLGEELGPRASGAGLRKAIRRGVVHYYHPGGTCAMGPVVGADAAVHGLEALYVADCSIMPAIPRANTNVPAAVIGLKVASLLGRLDADDASLAAFGEGHHAR